jgi:hypothetical protein
MTITDYALPIEQVRSTKARTAGRFSLSMMLFVASVSLTVVAKLVG